MNEAKTNTNLSLCFICRNGDEAELKTLPLMLESVKDYVDEICATVTMPSKEANNGVIPRINPRTEAILDKYDCKKSRFLTRGNFIQGLWFINNFAEARNFNFNQASNDMVLWLDSDDELINADKLPKVVKYFKDCEQTSLFLQYHYAHDEDGNCIMIFPRERIVKKHLYTWHSRLHETLRCKYKQTALPIIDLFHVKHNAQIEIIGEKAIRNLHIILSVYEEEKEAGKLDPNTVYDYARSCIAVKDFDRGVKLFHEFMNLSDDEDAKYECLMRLVDAYLNLGEVIAAKEASFRAINNNCNYPEAYLRLAKTHFHLKEYDKCLNWLNIGLTDKEGQPRKTSATFPQDPLNMSLIPKRMAATCYFYSDPPQARKALRLIKECQKIVPSDKSLIEFEKVIIKFLNFQKGCDGALTMLDMLTEEGDEEKTKAFIVALPEMVKQRREFLKLKNQFFPKPKTNRLVIFCERSIESWCPDSVNTGIGGSEEAVINMGERLQKLGWKVEVFNQCDKAQEFNGVKYIPYDQYDFYQECDVFIAWRYVDYIPFAPKTSVKILWLHDVQKIEDYAPQTIAKIDKIFVLSKFHRDLLPDIPDDKFLITSNGIDPSHFEGITVDEDGEDMDILKNENNYIYASAPNRGLELILEHWGEVIEMNPDAKLHCFYGFGKGIQALDVDLTWQALEKDIMNKIASYNGSVIWHGRVGHQELANWFMQCAFWLYPCIFPEISCITAMKAQAAGCWPICNDYAALKETVKYGTITKIKSLSDENWVRNWVDSIKLASIESTLESVSKMREDAFERFDWSTVANNWSKLFKRIRADKDANSCQ